MSAGYPPHPLRKVLHMLLRWHWPEVRLHSYNGEPFCHVCNRWLL